MITFPGDFLAKVSCNVLAPVARQDLLLLFYKAGNPFVLAGTSNLPALLPALQSGLRRMAADIPASNHNRGWSRV